MASSVELLDNLSLLVQVKEPKANPNIKTAHRNSMVRPISHQLTHHHSPLINLHGHYQERCRHFCHDENHQKVQPLI